MSERLSAEERSKLWHAIAPSVNGQQAAYTIRADHEALAADHKAALERIAELEDLLNADSTVALLRASHEKAKRNRDNWKARALALERVATAADTALLALWKVAEVCPLCCNDDAVDAAYDALAVESPADTTKEVDR